MTFNKIISLMKQYKQENFFESMYVQNKIQQIFYRKLWSFKLKGIKSFGFKISDLEQKLLNR